MPLSEFALIRRYFERRPPLRADVLLGVGDDAALLKVPEDRVLVATVDMLVAGRHFRKDADPRGIGHKALAVNLSDLAAMGAEPAWATLTLALPEADETWLGGFCDGLFALAECFGVQLVGGDTTRGPLTIAIQAHGFVRESKALRRNGARPGDSVCVTGTLGDAGLALALAEGQINTPDRYRQYLQDRLDRPTPRIRQGIDLAGLASAAIDISDGLAQDLGHILERSAAGARLWVDRLPRSPALAILAGETALPYLLAGGDDYELCFTVPAENLAKVRARIDHWDCNYTEIGVIEAEPGLRCVRDDGTLYRTERLGYDHFL